MRDFRIEHPPIGEVGSGDSESNREKLADAEDEVAYRKRLLAELGTVQKKWARAISQPENP